jgi:hypothetical protein
MEGPRPGAAAGAQSSCLGVNSVSGSGSLCLPSQYRVFHGCCELLVSFCVCAGHPVSSPLCMANTCCLPGHCGAVLSAQRCVSVSSGCPVSSPLCMGDICLIPQRITMPANRHPLCQFCNARSHAALSQPLLHPTATATVGCLFNKPPTHARQQLHFINRNSPQARAGQLHAAFTQLRVLPFLKLTSTTCRQTQQQQHVQGAVGRLLDADAELRP